MNEIANLKTKARELEHDKLQLIEVLDAREQALQKIVKEKEYIYGEMIAMKQMQMHLSQQIDESKAMSRVGESGSSIIPHYAEKLKRNREVEMRPGNLKLVAKVKRNSEATKKKKERNTATRGSVTLDDGGILSEDQKIPLETKSFQNQESYDDLDEDKNNPRRVSFHIPNPLAVPEGSIISVIERLDDEPPAANTDPNSDTIRKAKIHLEYDAYVKSKK
jgi:hypothetical protein